MLPRGAAAFSRLRVSGAAMHKETEERILCVKAEY